MRVMVMGKATASTEAGVLAKTEDFEAMGAYNEELVKAGILLAAGGLKPSSAGARVRFSETKELVAGWSILEVGSMEEAVEWVRRMPNTLPDEEFEVEIRPILEPEDFGDAFTTEQREAMDRRRATAAEQHGQHG
jgi:hypothetical protein